MNNRLDVRVAIVGEPQSGKSTFMKMLFLNGNLIEVADNVKKFTQVWYETDLQNFPKHTHTIIAQTQKHNNKIISNCLSNCISNNMQSPIIYNCVERAIALMDYTRQDAHVNRNILFTFYMFNNDYTQHIDKLTECNIIIYIIDKNNVNFAAQLKSLIDIVLQNKCYLLTLINKCRENLHLCAEEKTHILNIENMIRQYAVNLNIQNYLLSPLDISLEFSAIIREIMHNKKVSENDNVKRLKNIFNDIENINQIINKSNKLLQLTGYNTFKNTFLHILSANYKSFVESNILSQINNAITEWQRDLKDLHENLIPQLINAQTKFNRLGKILKTDYSNHTIVAVKNIIDYIHSHDISYYYEPSIVTKLFKLIQDSQQSNDSHHNEFRATNITQIATCICEIYTHNLTNEIANNHVILLYKIFFNKKEIDSFSNLLYDISKMIPFNDYKNYLVRILLTKLKFITNLTKNKDKLSVNKIKTLINYCKTLHFLLIKPINANLQLLCENIRQVCEYLLRDLTNAETQLSYVCENLKDIMQSQHNSNLNLEKFIFNIIKNKNYTNIVADDEYDSNNETYSLDSGESSDESSSESPDELSGKSD